MVLSGGRFVVLLLLSLFVVNGEDKLAKPPKPAAAAALTTTKQPVVNGLKTPANNVIEAPGSTTELLTNSTTIFGLTHDELQMLNRCCANETELWNVHLWTAECRKLFTWSPDFMCEELAENAIGNETVNITMSPVSFSSSTPSTTSSTSSSTTSSTTTSAPSTETTTEKPKHANGNESVWVALKPSAYNKMREPAEVYYFMAKTDTMRSPNADEKGKNDVLFGFMIAFNVLWFIIFLLTPLFAFKHPSRIQPSIREAVNEEKAVIRTDTTPTDDAVIIEPEGLNPAQAPSSTENQSTPPENLSTPT